MATGTKAGSFTLENGVTKRRSSKHKDNGVKGMDNKAVFVALYTVCEENIAFFARGHKRPQGETTCRLVEALTLIQDHARSLEPVISGFTTIYHHFDVDPQTPANGYRSLVNVVRCCLFHIIHKGRYIASNRHSVFFRAAHNASEMEAYCSALRQLRALLYLAQRLLHDNGHGNLFFQEKSGLSETFVREYASMHKGCFYGRCLGFQFTPAIRPFLQTIAIGLVSFGENYKKHQSRIGVAASSLFTSGKYAIDPELRGAEFERITQNLDVHFWKSFWNITETELLSGLASMTSTLVRVNRTLSVPPNPFALPLVSDPSLSVTITPPVAHCGPAPIQMRLVSYDLREGQDSEELLAISRSEGLSLGMKSKRSPPSPWLLVHYHGGGFVAQTSKSHEPYLKSWSQELAVPILSVDYSLAPEAPFPRALEECFYAYCWALKNSHLLGWTGERVCLAGDSAGGNLCVAVSMRAISHGVRAPDGIMAAYPALLVTGDVSPSRLLTLMDPLLPLSVLTRCLSAYAGTEPQAVKQLEQLSTLGMVRRDTVLLLRDFKQGASNWIQSLLDSSHASSDTVRKSVSEASISSPHSDPPQTSLRRDSLKSQTCQDLGSHGSPALPNMAPPSESGPKDVSFFLAGEDEQPASDLTPPPSAVEALGSSLSCEFPEGFEPLRSEQLAPMTVQSLPIIRDPYMSPLLAPDSMLRGLPPIHIVACALDPMLDDSVMFARRLRNLDQPVRLYVVEDLPHGFLSLSQLSRETREATSICVGQIREIFMQQAPPLTTRKHRKLTRTDQGIEVPVGSATGPSGGTNPEDGSSAGEEAQSSWEEGVKRSDSDSRETGT